jgi:aldehyde dehydrogenase (NAD+)
MADRSRIYVGGEWVSSTGSDTIDVINSATEEVIDSVPAGTAADVDKAVTAAAAAFPAWSAMARKERMDLVAEIGTRLGARMAEIGELTAQELGMPVQMSTRIQAGLSIGAFTAAVTAAEELEWESEMGSSLIVREPIGVVGAITPWNYPLKPSEVTPLSSFILAEVIHEVGLPAGVFNLVTGVGPVVGEAIARHPKVDMVSFTGSTRAGQRVMQLAAETIKRVSLELGGKSANVLLDGADLAKAVPAGLMACFLNSGQTCSALTRMLVPRSRLAEVEALALAGVAPFAPGDPFEKGRLLGPLVSAVQRDRVRGFIAKGLGEGARLVCGGADAPEGLDKGFYVQPTIFSDVTPDMAIAQEEIFGPVLVIIPYDTEDEAVEIANGTPYGLAGAVWGPDTASAEAIARRMRTGQVDINGGAYNPVAPFGGYKQSGLGRERGVFGLEEFLEIKSLQR